MNSNRKDRPKRSSHASDSPGRTYRFKSYLDANTQELARFDAMQEHVPDKIDEVMASFREEKLTVQPQRSKQVADEIASANTPFFSTAKPEHPKKKSIGVWPWYAGFALVAVGIVVFLSSGKSTEGPAVVAAPATPAAVIAPSVGNAGQEDSAAAGLVRQPVVAKVEAKPEPVAIKPAEAVPVKAKKSESKPAVTESSAPAKKKPKKPAPVHTYSEDLTDILQQR